jgi:hypothetical protein
VRLQIVRDRVVRFNARGRGPDRPQALGGQPPSERCASSGSDPHDRSGPHCGGAWGVRRRLVDLVQWHWEEFRITISKQTLSRELPQALRP